MNKSLMRLGFTSVFFSLVLLLMTAIKLLMSSDTVSTVYNFGSISLTGNLEYLRFLASENGDKIPFTLFGAIPHLDVIIGSFSIIIIILAVQAVHSILRFIHEKTQVTPFKHTIIGIENELMVVGLTAFIFKIIVNTSEFLDDDWFHGLEYAEILIPVFSFSYSGIGLIIIFHSIKHVNLWCKAYHSTLLDVLDLYFTTPDNVISRWFGKRYEIVSEVEFRISFNIFCETFKIKKNEFPFNEYMEKVFENFVGQIVEIRLVDWFLLSCVILLNLVRKELNFDIYKCEKTDIHCHQDNNTILFICTGAVLFAITLFFAFLSRWLQLQIMKKRGIPSEDYYHSYLMQNLKNDEKENDYLNAQQLKRTAELAIILKPPSFWINIQSRVFKSRKQKSQELIERLETKMPNFLSLKTHIIRRVSMIQLDSQPKKSRGSIEFTNQNSNKIGKIAKSVRMMDQSSSRGKDLGESLRSFYFTPRSDVKSTREESYLEDCSEVDNCVDNDVEQGSDNNLPENSIFPEDHSIEHISSREPNEKPSKRTESSSRNFTSQKSEAAKSTHSIDLVNKACRNLGLSYTAMDREKDINVYLQRLNDLQHPEDCLKSIFPFGRPVLYFEGVQSLILFIGLYYALFFTNFIVSARSSDWIMYSFIPGFLCSAMYIYIVRNAALLAGIYAVDFDAVTSVAEQTEGSQFLAEKLRNKILVRLKDLGEPQAELFDIFQEIDKDQKGFIKKEEFAVLVHAIEIDFSKKQLLQVFRRIDRNSDGKISYEEFFLFLFPEHHVGLALEKRRLQILRNRVNLKIQELHRKRKYFWKRRRVDAFIVPETSSKSISARLEDRVGNVEASVRNTNKEDSISRRSTSKQNNIIQK